MEIRFWLDKEEAWLDATRTLMMGVPLPLAWMSAQTVGDKVRNQQRAGQDGSLSVNRTQQEPKGVS